MGIMIRTVCALLQADIEIDHALALLAVIDVVMLVPLVVAIVPCMEVMVVEIPGARAEVVGATSIVNEVHKTAIVGAIVLLVMARPYLHLDQNSFSMITLSRRITSKVSLACKSHGSHRSILIIHTVLSRTLFVGGVT